LAILSRKRYPLLDRTESGQCCFSADRDHPSSWADFMTYLQPLTLLRGLIAEAEERFGKRSQHRWLAVGLAVDGRNPMTTIVKHGETKCMLVLVGEDLLNDPETLTYQLAHEAVHCLGSCENTTRLEEGLATYFGIHNSKLSPARSQSELGRLDADRRDYLADVSACFTSTPPR
jgi:hypothetical protein